MWILLKRSDGVYKEYVPAGNESYTLSPLTDEGEGLFTPSEVCFIAHEIIARYEKLLSLLHDDTLLKINVWLYNFATWTEVNLGTQQNLCWCSAQYITLTWEAIRTMKLKNYELIMCHCKLYQVQPAIQAQNRLAHFVHSGTFGKKHSINTLFNYANLKDNFLKSIEKLWNIFPKTYCRASKSPRGKSEEMYFKCNKKVSKTRWIESSKNIILF